MGNGKEFLLDAETTRRVRMLAMDLRTYRKQQGWTQAELGNLVGVSGVTSHRWERGAARPSLDAVEAIQRISGGAVTVSELCAAGVGATSTRHAAGRSKQRARACLRFACSLSDVC